MTQEELMEGAQVMFLQNKGRKEVLDFLTENGVAEDEVDGMATEAFASIKEARRDMIAEETGEPRERNVSTSLIIGGLVLLGGIVATMMTDSIYYGAMIVGVIIMFKGLLKL